MKRILVPTDFTSCAENALDFAVQFARLAHAEILLLHAFEETGSLYTDFVGVNREFVQMQFHEATAKLSTIGQGIKNKDGIPIETKVSAGTVKKCILKEVAEEGIDFIIMGTAGASGIKETLWGSNTANVISKAKVPVLVIPCDYQWKKPGQILLATNHFEEDSQMLNFLFEISGWTNAVLSVAVFTDEGKDSAITYLEHMRKTPIYEHKLKGKYHADTLTVTNVFGTGFEKTMEAYINTHQIDLLSMITYHKSFPDNLFHPSLTKKMAYHTKIPLLAIPANMNN